MSVPRVYLDSNVFITAFENAGARSDHAWWLLHAIEAGQIAAVTSEITLAEILVKPIEAGDDELAESYQAMLTSGPVMEVLPVARGILVGAAGIRARRPAIRLPDAIHVATARSAGCTHFISNDERLTMPEGLRRLSLSPFTLDDLREDHRD
ncbi:type II toxin-antitoxin system VapC family toxin [Ancylobacter lacus]|uniref:type II toxin-antitoxin system VapC family toxin n=1 Tax=Ancylobacter lacus TaxID=2579970 RepID=UPI001BD0179F|nr:PIN domain-containing protein [Ancylobacter lacus]